MLWRKLFRDIREQKGAYIACVIIILIGLMSFTAYSVVMDNLLVSQQSFYQDQNFAEGFAEFQAMPYKDIEKIKTIPGINQAQGRLIKDVQVLFPGFEDNIYLRLVSMDPSQEQQINSFQLIQGSPLDTRGLNAWVDNKFFEARQLELNQEIEIIAEGKRRNLRITGMGRSPEFIYAMRTATDLFPTPGTFGIVYIPFESMKNLFSEGSTYNSLVYTLKPGADYQTVEDLLKPELKAYGLKNIYPRKDQVSHRLLSDELNQLAATSRTLPVIFLSVAGMILYNMLKRMVERQRGQIGILKAFGYTSWEIILHYLSYAVLLGLAGGILGGLAGIALSYPYTSLYELYFNMPGLEGRFSPRYFFLGLLLSLTFSIIAGYQGCKGVLALEPAEAMRPPAPLTGQKTPLEKIAFLWQALTVQGKMAVRNMFRNKARTFFAWVGVALAFLLVALPLIMFNLSDAMIFDQFEKVQIYNLKINFQRPLDGQKAMREIAPLPGVNLVEPLSEIPVTLKNNWFRKDTVLLGIPAGSRLYNILDKEDNKIQPPKDGILISERLATVLNVQKGSVIKLESPYFKDPEHTKNVKVAEVIPQYMGSNAYMETESLYSLLQQGNLTTSLMVSIDESSIPQLADKYKNSALVTGMDDRGKSLRQMKEMMASYTGMIYAMTIFGIVICFAVIYNSSIVTLSERSRELATMLVLGMTPGEVLSVVSFEQWFIFILALPLGIPLTKLLLVAMAQSLSNDLYGFPATLDAGSLLLTLLITAASVWLAQLAAARRIREISIVEVLKARE